MYKKRSYNRKSRSSGGKSHSSRGKSRSSGGKRKLHGGDPVNKERERERNTAPRSSSSLASTANRYKQMMDRYDVMNGEYELFTVNKNDLPRDIFTILYQNVARNPRTVEKIKFTGQFDQFGILTSVQVVFVYSDNSEVEKDIPESNVESIYNILSHGNIPIYRNNRRLTN